MFLVSFLTTPVIPIFVGSEEFDIVVLRPISSCAMRFESVIVTGERPLLVSADVVL